MLEHGVPAGKMVIGHLGDTDDVAFIEGILRRGSYAGLDRFGLDWIFPDEKRIAVLAQLVKRGWRDKLVLSHDCSVFIDEFDNEWNERSKVDLDIPSLPVYTSGRPCYAAASEKRGSAGGYRRHADTGAARIFRGHEERRRSMSEMADLATGLQHVGIPVENMDDAVCFL